jgi:hypothetical protein
LIRNVIAALAALALSGCSLFVSSGPSPRAEDCALVQQATPTRYYCDGKMYTSVQLTDIRDGKTTATK